MGKALIKLTLFYIVKSVDLEGNKCLTLKLFAHKDNLYGYLSFHRERLLQLIVSLYNLHSWSM